MLLIQMAAGNENAFQQLFNTYSDRIYGVAFTYTKSIEMSEEIVQDVFLTIWVKRSTLSAIRNFSDYLFIIARNKIINTLRRSKLEKSYLLQPSDTHDDLTPTPEQLYHFKETRRIIENAINLLPPQQKLIYQLNQLQGIPLGEIAIKLGLSRNTTRNHLSRAMLFIRHYVQQHSDDCYVIFLLLLLKFR
ncbi:RNA polymerase sigma factor [Chitinophaga sp. RAB17]|uniref:RNA polymerase sigma factor n=1 Tax=Chitinophaga sp. RAB17 TaxID=3233049 RepID=UPI003F93F748